MNQKIADKVNGWGPVLRLVTPIMVGICLALTGYVLSDIRDIKTKDYTTRAEVNDMIANAPYPYIPDKNLIHSRLDIVDRQLEKVNNKLEAIEDKLNGRISHGTR